MKKLLAALLAAAVACGMLGGCAANRKPAASSAPKSAAASSIASSGAATSAAASSAPAQSPANAKAMQLVSQSFSYYSKQEYAQAEKLAEEALQADPNCYQAVNMKGISLCYLGYLDKGRPLVEQSIQMNPNYAYGYFNLAMTYKFDKQYQKSIDNFHKSLALNPNDAWGYYGISTVYADMGQVQNSLDYLKKAIDLNPAVKDSARVQHHYDNMRNNPDFQKLVNGATSTAAPSSSSGSAAVSVLYPNAFPVLMYHSVAYEKNNILRVPKEDFGAEMKWLYENGYRTVTLDDLYIAIQSNQPFPPKTVAVTLDDGYEDNYVNAFPVLKQYHFVATIFMIAGNVGKSACLTAAQLKEMSDYGIRIESHTQSHPHMKTLGYEQQLQELVSANKTLETITGQKPLYLAYPYGEYNDDTITAAKAAGYCMAFTMSGPWKNPQSIFYTFPRVFVDKDLAKFQKLFTH